VAHILVRPCAEENQNETHMTFPKRGDLYLVEFDPARGHEIQKTLDTATMRKVDRAMKISLGLVDI
jgi:hypothetical protein